LFHYLYQNDLILFNLNIFQIFLFAHLLYQFFILIYSTFFYAYSISCSLYPHQNSHLNTIDTYPSIFLLYLLKNDSTFLIITTISCSFHYSIYSSRVINNYQVLILYSYHLFLHLTFLYLSAIHISQVSNKIITLIFMQTIVNYLSLNLFFSFNFSVMIIFFLIQRSY
jgi:hypothetical protein